MRTALPSLVSGVRSNSRAPVVRSGRRRRGTLLKRQEEKTELNKRKEDFALLTASTAGMSPRRLAAHNFYKGMILGDIEAKMAAAEAVAATPPPEAEPTPAGVSATSSATTHASAASASVLASATEQADWVEHDEVVVLDGPTVTQDAPSTSPNLSF
jgi:hypothetical protein